MDIEAFRTCCLSVKGAEESLPFIDPNVLVFKVMGKMFAYVDLAPKDGLFRAAMKCDPARSTELRERYRGITRGRFETLLWNDLVLDSDLPDELIEELIHHAAAEVIQKLPKYKQAEYRNS